MCSIVSLLTLDHIIHNRSRLEIEPHFILSIIIIVAIASGEFHSPYFTRFELLWGRYMLNCLLTYMIVLKLFALFLKAIHGPKYQTLGVAEHKSPREQHKSPSEQHKIY